jgi:transcriptional regulator with XRE-family HTH domain
MIVGERLKAVRESKQMSQGDVEKKTGLLRSYISRCESGHTVPSLETLQKWASAFDITLSQLFAEDGEPAAVLPALKNRQRAPKLNRIAAKHLRKVELAFQRMPTRDTALIAAFATKLAAQID